MTAEAAESGLPPRPYPGLRPFEPSEWAIFFGRESMTQDTIDRVVANRLVAVHGDSGCGKSSLIAAGVMPMLKHDQARAGGRWRTCIMRPGGAPLWNLAEALASLDGGGPERAVELRRILNRGADAPKRLAKALGCGPEENVCILFDQFEELFEHARAQGPVEAELVTAFLGGLAAGRPRGLHAILTMRSDYLGQCAQYRGFAETVNATQYLVPRMERPALLRAIREPAELHGGSVSLDLAERLIADAGTGQDQLPLIQHGLMLLWQDKRDLTLEDYSAQGDLASLLSDHADRLIAPGEEVMAERVFRALTGRNAEGLAIRHRQTFAELRAVTGAENTALQRLLARFRAAGASFLRPYGEAPLAEGDEVDISHEAFIRNWRKIAAPAEGWLDREAEDGLVWTALRMQAGSFSEDKTKLLSLPVALERRDWIGRHTEKWSRRYGGGWQPVGALIEESHRVGQREAWRDRILLRTSVALAIFMAGLGVFSYLQMEKARLAEDSATRAAERAELNETISLAALSRIALSEDDTIDAIKLALAAWPRVGNDGRPRLKQIWKQMGAALFRHSEVRLTGHEGNVTSASFSPDGNRVITGSWDNTARVWSVEGGDAIATLEGHENWVIAASFSPDGARAATASYDNTAKLWDVHGKKLIATMTGHNEWVVSAAFSPDGTRIVTASWDDTARLWDGTSGAAIATLAGHSYDLRSARFSPDGTRIVTASDDNSARVWDARNGTAIAKLTGHESSVYSAVFSPDGTRVATASGDNTARLLDARSGAVIATLAGHKGSVYSANFSPDGTRIVTASDDGTARLWDARSGTAVAWFAAHDDGVGSATFSRDGKIVLTTPAQVGLEPSPDTAARLWDGTSGTAVATIFGHRRGVYSAAFSPDSTHIVTASGDQTARIWDMTMLDNTDAFAIACQRLAGNTGLADVEKRYGLAPLPPICGAHAPFPVDLSKLQ